MFPHFDFVPALLQQGRVLQETICRWDASTPPDAADMDAMSASSTSSRINRYPDASIDANSMDSKRPRKLKQVQKANILIYCLASRATTRKCGMVKLVTSR